MDPGAGSLSGRICFDIAESNDGDACGDLASRQGQKADFEALTDADKIYTFTANGSGSNLHFVVDDPYKCLVEASPWSAAGISGSFTTGGVATLTLNYKTTLNAHVAATGDPLIYGLTRSDAAWVKVYAVFNNGTGTVSVPLTVKIQDCMCCRAKVSPTEWKDFMCHNLGADETANPFDPRIELNGAYYQWGRKDAVANAPHAKYPNTSYAADAVIGTWNTSEQPDGSWLDAYKNKDNDPCPPGWRVPTRTQWQDVIANNTITPIPSGTWTSNPNNFATGKKFGNGLFLPATGYRTPDNGTLGSRAFQANYWCTTLATNNKPNYLYFVLTSTTTTWTNPRTNGHSVRCVSE
jgi:uncharacterized protein (TIGR02145 family)